MRNAVKNPEQMGTRSSRRSTRRRWSSSAAATARCRRTIDDFLGTRHGVRPAAARHRQQLRADARHSARPATARSRSSPRASRGASTSAASTATISSTPPRSACAPLVAESVPHGLKRYLGRVGYLLWAGWSAGEFQCLPAEGRRRRAHATVCGRPRCGSPTAAIHGGIELIEERRRRKRRDHRPGGARARACRTWLELVSPRRSSCAVATT